jgi:hypothetical protein
MREEQRKEEEITGERERRILFKEGSPLFLL